MTTAIDPEYDRLLHQIQPRPPRSKKENARLLAEIETLMKKGEEKLSSAEDAMLALLFNLVREYERGTYPRRRSTPAEMLDFLMQESGLTPADVPLPEPRVPEILSGKRGLSKEEAKKLGAFFRVSPALFV